MLKESNSYKKSPKKIYIRTYGCQMNAYDSEAIEGMFCERGYTSAPSEEEADVIVINTCSVRDLAEKKVIGKMGILSKLKKENPNLVLVLAGCMAQNRKEELLKILPGVDLVCGPNDIFQLPDFVQRAMQGERRLVFTDERSCNIMHADIPKHRKSSVSAWVSVMRGCNHSCSYCIVPRVRGREVSRTPEDLSREIEMIISSGFKEITLLGQNINSYGRDLKKGLDFPKLLKIVHEIKGLMRIRFLTSHPVDIRDALMQSVADLDKVCAYFHFPVQSGSNRILQLMKRGYTREGYMKTVEKLRNIIPDVSLSTDVIVGFPGETEQDFQDTLDLMERVGFDSAYLFKYSVRSGTPASLMQDQIPEQMKVERHRALFEFQTKIAHERNQSFAQREVEILVEKREKSFHLRYQGRTKDNHIVYFESQENCVGEFKRVRINRVSPFALYGEKIDQMDEVKH